MFFIRNNRIFNSIAFHSIHSIRKLTNSSQNDLLLQRLRSLLGDNCVSIAPSVREQHGRDESLYTSAPPDVVVFPQNTSLVSEVHKLCYEYNVPIIPFGTGTGLEGGVNALEGGVCVDLKHMNRVLEVNEEDFDCTVEAGIDWRSLNQYLRDSGLFFPVDPGASASIGGMAATCASGTNAMTLGTMKQNVLNMEVVLANGAVIHTSGKQCRARKTSAGYDLTSLVVGSEGTLGTITTITLRLSAIPNCVALGVCSFPDDRSAIDSVIEILQSNIPVARVEYLDDVSIQACRSYSKVDLAVSPALFIEFSGHTVGEVNDRSDAIKQIALSKGGTDFVSSSDAEESKKLWKARHDLYYACKALKPNATVVITDVCVPISRLTEMVLRAKQLIASERIIGPVLGHVGDGNFHAILLCDPDSAEDVQRVRSVANKIGEIALELCGTCTGEHGIGRGKVQLMRKQYDSTAIEMMKNLKLAFDPKNLMNPKKLF